MGWKHQVHKQIRNKYQLLWKMDFLRAAILEVVTFYGWHYYLYHPLGKPVNKSITNQNCTWREIQTPKWLVFVSNFSHTLVLVSNLF